MITGASKVLPSVDRLNCVREQSMTERKGESSRMAFLINTVALSFLFIGYFLTTGTALIDSDLIKVGFRLISLALFLFAVLLVPRIRLSYLLTICFLIIYYIINQSAVVVNVMYLVIMAISLHRLNPREASIAIIAPVFIIVILHLMLLSMGKLDASPIDIGERTRSTMGFANANQASAIYLSLSILALFAHQMVATKASLILVLASFLVGFAVVGMTDSRTSMFAMLLVLALKLFEYLFQRIKAYRVVIRNAAAASAFVASAITYFIATSNSLELDILLSLRPYYFSEFLRSATPFEFIIGWSTIEGFGVDNLFLMLLSGFGVIGSIFIILTVSYRIYRMSFGCLAIVITMMSASVFEGFLIRPEIPISVLFMYLLLARYLKNEKSALRF